MMKSSLFIALFLLSLGCFAAVYMQTDKNGTITYSDTPENNAQPVKLPESNNNISVPQGSPSSSQSTTLSTTPAAPAGKQAATKGYTTFTMTDPTDQETFQNQRDIPITLKIEPPLQEGDKIQVYLDGNPVGEATGDPTQLVLHEVERGEHQISVTLMDAAGHVLKKVDGVTVFIHYSAIPTGSGAVKAGSSAP